MTKNHGTPIVFSIGSSISCIAAAVVLFAVATPAHGQWVEPGGQGWASFSMFYQDTDEQYGRTGDRTKLPRGGKVQTASAFLTVAMGIAPGVDVWIQPSFRRLQFTEQGRTRTSTGLGDMRFYLRASPAALLGGDFPFAIRAGLKTPVSDGLIGTNLVPLGDNQRDWEIAVELGHSFWPQPFYIAAWAGYRWREAGDFTSSGIWEEMLRSVGMAGAERFDFGNERFFNVSLGGGGDRVGFKAQLEGWFGAEPALEGMMLDDHVREMVRFIPSLLVTAGPGQIEVGSRLPLSGKNLVTGPEFVLGYFTRFSL